MAIAARWAGSYSFLAVEKTLQSRVVERAAELLGGPQELATRLGVSQPMVRAWMSGFVRPPDSHFFRLVDLLGESDDRPT